MVHEVIGPHPRCDRLGLKGDGGIHNGLVFCQISTCDRIALPNRLRLESESSLQLVPLVLTEDGSKELARHWQSTESKTKTG